MLQSTLKKVSFIIRKCQYSLIFCRYIRPQSFHFLGVKYVQKSETLTLKNLYQLQKIGYFWILIFGLNLNISGTLAYNFFFALFSGKKSCTGINSQTQFLRKSNKFYVVLSSIGVEPGFASQIYLQYKLDSTTSLVLSFLEDIKKLQHNASN